MSKVELGSVFDRQKKELTNVLELLLDVKKIEGQSGYTYLRKNQCVHIWCGKNIDVGSLFLSQGT